MVYPNAMDLNDIVSLQLKMLLPRIVYKHMKAYISCNSLPQNSSFNSTWNHRERENMIEKMAQVVEKTYTTQN